MKFEGYINDFDQWELGVSLNICEDENFGTSRLLSFGVLFFSLTITWKI